jgi:hypothetical protein
MKIAIDIRNIGKGRTGDEAVFFFKKGELYEVRQIESQPALA